MTQIRPLLDAVDLKALAILMQRGRTAWSELAGALGMSPPAAAERVKRLEERGAIRGFSADVNHKSIGLDVLAFVKVTLVASDPPDDFVQWVEQSRWVKECHHVAGDCDYLLKLYCTDTGTLEAVLTKELRRVRCVMNTCTTIVFSTVKDTSVLPIEPCVESETLGEASNPKPNSQMSRRKRILRPTHRVGTPTSI